MRGQFKGYRKEAGVAPNSTVETFAAVRLHIDSWRWEDVPFFIRAGKCLPVTTTEVLVTLKRPPLRKVGDTNYFRFRLSPEVIIAVGSQIKRPGEQFISESTELKVVHNAEGDEMDAYERLLSDAMAGDGMLFAREDAVEAAWAVGAADSGRCHTRSGIRARHLGSGASRRSHRRNRRMARTEGVELNDGNLSGPSPSLL